MLKTYHKHVLWGPCDLFLDASRVPTPIPGRWVSWHASYGQKDLTIRANAAVDSGQQMCEPSAASSSGYAGGEDQASDFMADASASFNLEADAG